MFITMLLGGLWHGASWNFVLWGALHGAALGVHRAWAAWLERRGGSTRQVSPYRSFVGWLATLLFCCLAWIPFRSPSFETTGIFLRGLLPGGEGIVWYHTPTLMILSLAVAWHALWQFAPRAVARLPFKPNELSTWPAMLTLGYALLLLVLLMPLNTQPFIYFQF